MDDTISLVLRYDGTIDQFKLDALNDDGSIKNSQYKNKVVFIYGATQDSDASSLIQSIWVSDSENGKFFDLTSKGNAGGLLYGGTIENRAIPSIDPTIPSVSKFYIRPTIAYLDKHYNGATYEEILVTTETLKASEHKGEYFIVAGGGALSQSFEWGGVNYSVGDWMISNGISWQKIDNSDAVTSVAGLVGDISTTQLAQALSSKNLSEERLAQASEVEETLESYAKMPTEQPLQDSILRYDSDNKTFKGSDVLISTTEQDIYYGDNSKIPTCGQVAEYVEESVLGKQDTIEDLDIIRSGACKGTTSVQKLKINGEEKTPEDGIIDLGKIEGEAKYITTLVYKASSKIENSNYPWGENTFGAPIIKHNYNDTIKEGVIYFNDRITTIGNYAFRGCSSLTSVTIPDSVTTIGNMAFYNCSNLTSVTIPDSVTEIGYQAFHNCYSLTTVTIPDSVTSIGTYAFYYCRNLTSVYCEAVAPPTTMVDSTGWWFAFDFNASDRKIYVPMESVDTYKSKYRWGEYADDIVGYYTNENITDELTSRNVGAVDPAGEVDDTISLATTEYVDNAIASAITTTLNTPV